MKLLKTFDQIATQNKDGKYIALGNNGKKYNASYSSEFGCMFFCIPQTVKVVGYFEKGIAYNRQITTTNTAT